MNYLDERIDTLVKKSRLQLSKQGFDEKDIRVEIYLNMRYDRTDCALMCSPIKTKSLVEHAFISYYGDFLTTFTQRYAS